MGDSAFYVATLGSTVLLLTASLLFIRKHSARNRQQELRLLLVGNLALLLSLLAVSFTALETYYRFLYDSTDSFGLSKAMDRWMERHYQANDWGFRDNIDYSSRRSASSDQRITFLGDSFTAGHGIAAIHLNDGHGRLLRYARRPPPDVPVQYKVAKHRDLLPRRS